MNVGWAAIPSATGGGAGGSCTCRTGLGPKVVIGAGANALGGNGESESASESEWFVVRAVGRSDSELALGLGWFTRRCLVRPPLARLFLP